MFISNTQSRKYSTKLIYLLMFLYVVGIVVSNFNHNLTAGGCNEIMMINIFFLFANLIITFIIDFEVNQVTYKMTLLSAFFF